MGKKGIMEWAKDLKHNEKVAEKFTSVKTVSDILNIAKENGYEFTENELMDLDLDSVAGGGLFGGGSVTYGTGDIKVDVGVVTAVANVASTVTGSGSSSSVKPTINISQKA